MLDLFKRKQDGAAVSWTDRLKRGLALTREQLTRPITLPLGRKPVPEEVLEQLETALISADVGVPATAQLIADLAQRWKRLGSDADPRAALKEALSDLLAPLERPLVIGAERPTEQTLTAHHFADR